MFSEEIIKKLQKIDTPFYYYDIALLEKTAKMIISAASEANFIVHYALKANSNDKILDLIKNAGAGADCVSGNEVQKAIDCGFSPGKIAFAGVGKSDKEIRTALHHDIFCFNVESIPELEVIDQIAGAENRVARIALRINPNVNAKTHHYITTGIEENKFGINRWEFDAVMEKLRQLNNLELTGLHFHIGSQIKDLDVFQALCNRINRIQQWFIDHHFVAEHINAGGGLGVDYEHPDENLIPDFQSFFNIFKKFLHLQPGQELHFEIGRAIVAQCGSLITKVLFVKKGINIQFVIADAGMTELIRPALYQSVHKIQNLTSGSLQTERYDVVGPICESSDCFAKSIILPKTKRDDLLAIRTAGAYGEVMASQYNLRDLVQPVYSTDLI
jgi:diaminopimelate decarboxylase